jgi:hypothetical protein
MAMLGQASSLVLVRLGSFNHFPAKSCVKICRISANWMAKQMIVSVLVKCLHDT